MDQNQTEYVARPIYNKRGIGKAIGVLIRDPKNELFKELKEKLAQRKTILMKTGCSVKETR